LTFRNGKPYASSSKNAASPAAENTELNLEEDGCHLIKEDGSEDDMKEETEDVFGAGENASLKNEASSGPPRSRTQKSRELRSRPVLELAKSDTDRGAEDLPLEKVKGIFLTSKSESFILQMRKYFLKKLKISFRLVQLLGSFKVVLRGK
jgi:hypothetical protein